MIVNQLHPSRPNHSLSPDSQHPLRTITNDRTNKHDNVDTTLLDIEAALDGDEEDENKNNEEEKHNDNDEDEEEI